mmetsp:Transcript_43359/g.97608  ORF Transcript_43359/g.97608 Transcript_43359/m.97608 type:complete len:496 (+) Transcript_43359:1-1488(+)
MAEPEKRQRGDSLMNDAEWTFECSEDGTNDRGAIETSMQPMGGQPGHQSLLATDMGAASPGWGAPIMAASPRWSHQARSGTIADDPRQGTQTSAVLNLLATTMGAGLLSLPQAFAYTGWALGIGLMLVTSFCADLSLQFLVDLGRQSGRMSFEGNAFHYLGNAGKRGLNVLLIALLFLASVAMVIIIHDLLPAFIKNMSGHPDAVYARPELVTAVCLMLIYPVCLLKDLTPLRFTSALALFCIAYYYTSLTASFFGRHGGPQVHSSVVAINTDPLDVLQGWAIMVAAFICHFNIFRIDGELRATERRKIRRVVHIAIPGIATSIYITGGLMGYFYFGGAVQNNVLVNFHDNPLMSVARVALSLTNTFKLPLIVSPLRVSLQEVAPGVMNRCPTVEVAVLLALVFFTALGLGSLSKALGLVGCTCGVAACFIFPGLMRLKFIPVGPAAPPFPGETELKPLLGRLFSMAAMVLVVLGTLAGASAFVAQLVDWNHAGP